MPLEVPLSYFIEGLIAPSKHFSLGSNASASHIMVLLWQAIIQ